MIYMSIVIILPPACLITVYTLSTKLGTKQSLGQDENGKNDPENATLIPCRKKRSQLTGRHV